MWEKIIKILEILGHISTIIVIVLFLAGVWFCIRGFFPVLIRLGNGLWKRKIAILAKGDALISLENLLHDSKLFNRTNIIRIPSEDDFGMIERVSVLLIHWPDWQEGMEKIADRKMDGAAMVVYAPHESGSIPSNVMSILGKHRNITVNNFRGRLLNDLVISMITTGYEKK